MAIFGKKSAGLLALLSTSTLGSSAALPADATAAAAKKTIHYFSFGDSYTTTGFNASGTQPAAGNPMGNPALGKGTFAGGTNYVGFLATKYNSSLVLAYDFGYGGATISDSLVPTTDPSIHTFEQQVNNYFIPKYSSTASKIWTSDDSIFSVFFGINDIGLPLTSEPGALEDMNTRIPQLLDKYFALCTTLFQAGARRFMFVGVPPLDRSPYIAGMGADKASTYSSWVNAFNAQLAQRVNNFTAANTGAVAATYDYHRWMQAALDNPAALGFPDATCIDAGGQRCVWWNNYHVGSKFDDFLAMRMLPAMNSLGFNGSVPTGGYFY